MLLEKPDIDVNAKTAYDGQTALILAAAVDHQPIVEALLAHPGIEADAKTTSGYNAALYALMIGNTEIYNILQAHSTGGELLHQKSGGSISTPDIFGSRP